PQLVDSVLRVRRAQRLRGGGRRGLRGLRSILLPVLQDAFDRSLALAAAMDSRGYGRRGEATRGARLGSGLLVVAGLVVVCVGVDGLLDAAGPRCAGGPMMVAGLLSAVTGLALGGRLVRGTVYRPDRWRPAELAVAACGIAAAGGMFLTARIDPGNLYPS